MLQNATFTKQDKLKKLIDARKRAGKCINRVSCAHIQFKSHTQVPLDSFASGSVEIGSSNKGNTEGDEVPQRV